MISNKGVGPVIALTLLFVVATVSVVSMNSFLGNYLSDLNLKSEGKDDSFANIDIESMSSNSSSSTIYLRNRASSFLILDDIKLNGTSCTFLGSEVLLASSSEGIEVSCGGFSAGDTIEVLVISDELLISKYFKLK